MKSDSNDLVHFIGTCQNQKNKKLGIGYGTFKLSDMRNYDKSMGNPVYYEYDYVASPHNRACEKNWALFEVPNVPNAVTVVYEWSPLSIGRIIPNTDYGKSDDIYKYKLDLIGSQPTPDIFKNIRGSSNGCSYGDEIWFLCHLAEYSTPRKYYHIFVVLSKSLNKMRWSKLFKLEDENIEFSTGLVVTKDKITISYSVWDASSKVVSIDRNLVEEHIMLEK
jgi:hypothetical protein